MIFGIKRKIDNFDRYNVFFGYCYKYTHVTYDWFCGPGSQIYFLTQIVCHHYPRRNRDFRLFLNGYLKPFMFCGHLSDYCNIVCFQVLQGDKS